MSCANYIGALKIRGILMLIASQTARDRPLSARINVMPVQELKRCLIFYKSAHEHSGLEMIATIAYLTKL